MALASGRLRHKVELQEQVQTQDPVTGEILEAWQTIARPWAAVEPASMNAFIAAQARQSEVRGQFVIRQRDNINGAMRYVHRRKAYMILGVFEDKESGLEYQTCPVAEGVRLD